MRSVFQPQKPAEQGSVQQVVRVAYAEAGGPKRIAQALGVKQTQVYQYADPNGRQKISHEQVRALVRAGAREPVHDLCALAGGTFVPGTAHVDPVHELVRKSAVEHAEFMGRMLAAIADHHTLTEPEKIALAHEADDVIRPLVAARSKLLGLT